VKYNILKNSYLLVLLFFFASSGYSQPSNSYLDHSNSQEFIQMLYSYSFHSADSLLFSNPFFSQKNVTTDLLKANKEWWLLISGDNTANHSALCKQYLTLAEKKIDAIPSEQLNPVHVFNLITIYSYLVRLELMNKNYFQAIKYLDITNSYIEYSLQNDSKYEFFTLTSGLYYYMAEYSQEEYPVLYPYFLFCPKGNKEKGIALLKKCSESENLILKTEANYFLMKIYLYCEKDFEKASQYAEYLIHQYPANLIFQYEYYSVLHVQKKATMFSQVAKIKLQASHNNELNDSQKKHFIEIINKQNSEK